MTIQVSLLRGNGPVGGLPPGVEDRIIRYPRIFMGKADFTAIIERHYRGLRHSWDDREGPLTAEGIELCLGDNFVLARNEP